MLRPEIHLFMFNNGSISILSIETINTYYYHFSIIVIQFNKAFSGEC
jgi:hypothetical protein